MPSAGLRRYARQVVTKPDIGQPLGRGLRRVGAKQLGRRLSAAAGQPVPDVAVVELPPHLFHDRSLRMRTEGGRDVIARNIWAGGWSDWEPPLPAVYAATVRDGAVVLDIGANTGYYALLAASVGPSVAVHAFEPLPAVTDILRKNLGLNESGERINVVPRAVHDAAGEAELYIPVGDHAAVETSASLERSFRSVWSDSVTVACQTVDDYCESIPRVDVIKIDTECRERQVLCGARTTLRSKRPVVFLEVMDCEDWRSELGLLNEVRAEMDYVSVRMHQREAIISAEIGYDEPWRNQALWPAERVGALRQVCKRIRLAVN